MAEKSFHLTETAREALGVGDLNYNALAFAHCQCRRARQPYCPGGEGWLVSITQPRERLGGQETGKPVNSGLCDLGQNAYLFCSGVSCVKW